MNERNAFAWVLCIFVSFMVLFGRLASKPVYAAATPYYYYSTTISKSTTTTKSSSTSTTTAMIPPRIGQQQQQQQPLYRIFCYGDSLTAGTSPPSLDTFPYAPHLERTLRQHFNRNVVVQYRGLPGWTSAQLLMNDIQGALLLLPQPSSSNTNNDNNNNDNSASLSGVNVAVLLAGTNDLPEYAGVTNDASTKIVQSIIGLHQLCVSRGGIRHTVAVGIPPSAYQQYHPPAATLANNINEQLYHYCQQQQQRQSTTMTYIPFPLEFDRNNGYWAPDGLHCTPQGYQRFGELLAPIIDSILQQQELQQQNHQQQQQQQQPGGIGVQIDVPETI